MTRKRVILAILSLFGLAVSVKLMLIYMNVNFNPNAVASFCNINSYVDCDGVAQTDSARFAGIPMALWGIFLYTFLLFMTFVDKIQKLPLLGFLKIFKNQYAYIATIGVLTFFTSAGLACVSIFKIEKICILCFVTYFLNLIIAFVARDKENGFASDIVKSFADFFEAVKKPAYLIAFLACCLLFGGFVFGINKYKVFVPKVSPVLVGNTQRKVDESIILKDKNLPPYYHHLKKNPYKSNGNVLGNENATVVVNVYTDYYCPHCRVLNIMLHRAVKEMPNVKVIHHDFPLDPACNKIIRSNHSPLGCLAAQYSRAAEKQNRMWNMANILFDEKPGTEKEILKLSKHIWGINAEQLQKDANSQEIIGELAKDVASETDIDAVPTMIIGVNVYKGTMPYDELIKILSEAGGKLKIDKKN